MDFTLAKYVAMTVWMAWNAYSVICVMNGSTLIADIVDVLMSMMALVLMILLLTIIMKLYVVKNVMYNYCHLVGLVMGHWLKMIYFYP